MFEIKDLLGSLVKPKNLLILAIIAFIIGFTIGKIYVYNLWKQDIITTVLYIENYSFREKYTTHKNITYINNLIKTARQELDNKEYGKVVKTLNNIEEEYKTLEFEKEFQRLMKKIE